MTRRWIRWTDYWDDPTVPGDGLEIARNEDGSLRDYLTDRPDPRVPYVPSPRPPDPPPPPPTPTPEPDVTFRAVPRDELLDAIAWLRDEIYPGIVGHPLDDEGIAAWICDNYVRYRQTFSREDTRHRVFVDIERVVRPTPTPEPGAHPSPLVGRVTLSADGLGFQDEGEP